MTNAPVEHPDPAVAADDNHGSAGPDEDLAATAEPEALDPAHGPVPDGSPLSGSDPIGRAAGKP